MFFEIEQNLKSFYYLQQTVIKLSQNNTDNMQSFIDIHKDCKRALPKQMKVYKHAIQLHEFLCKHTLRGLNNPEISTSNIPKTNKIQYHFKH